MASCSRQNLLATAALLHLMVVRVCCSSLQPWTRVQLTVLHCQRVSFPASVTGHRRTEQGRTLMVQPLSMRARRPMMALSTVHSFR